MLCVREVVIVESAETEVLPNVALPLSPVLTSPLNCNKTRIALNSPCANATLNARFVISMLTQSGTRTPSIGASSATWCNDVFEQISSEGVVFSTV